ncbi:MAG: DUF3298 domain-containing protein [Bacteroidales bacterium]|nr:DUF3298 domain-containing protein [Bacteroidales bacterium]
MKRKISLFIYILLAGLTVLFYACDKEKVIQVGGIDEKNDYETFSTSAYNDVCDNYVFAEYPVTGDKPYLDSVKSWINAVLSVNPFSEYMQIEKINAKDKDIPALLEHYTNAKLVEIKDSVIADRIKTTKNKYYCKDSINITYKGDNIVSFVCKRKYFTGNIHGLNSQYSAVFDKKTGKRYGWEIIEKKDVLRDMIIESLLQYFKIEDKDALTKVLFVNNLSELPLPEQPPYFLENGMTLQYSQHEIAPYSAGTPYVTIAWNKLKDILTSEATDVLSSDISRYTNE